MKLPKCDMTFSHFGLNSPGLSVLLGTQNLPTTGSKLSEMPSEVKNTISPGSTYVMLQVKLLNSGFIPSTGPKAPKKRVIFFKNGTIIFHGNTFSDKISFLLHTYSPVQKFP